VIIKTPNSDLNRPDAERFKQSPKMPFAVVLEDVRSLNNVGSVFRTCDAFAAQELILTGLTGCPPHLDIHKTALGAEQTVSWAYFKTIEEALNSLKDRNFVVVGIEQTQPHIWLNEWVCDERNYAFVFGNEVYGLSQKALALCDFCIEIPQFGTKHSLNIAVSVGVVLWDFVAKSKRALV
jgi:tRNA G18 (ribose-2'-O)-methylase SpoU